ncbi:MAG: bifunctional glutamate N-acetyltransferase/amino-acid acetyltransferase ArgJ [Deltaproteobacteria bacterium]|nr:bifunctional glutamate N-acetyltransferase/amino-acid acetyltransferase ArgJ [Deltaproteobacteria bacterium]
MKTDTFTIPGFKASAVAAGLKKNNTVDLALIFSDKEAVAAGVFTTNKVKAAPVLLCMDHIHIGKARAIVANAGNANACTGKMGMENARQTADLVAKELGIQSNEILVASTGVIGAQLKIELIQKAIPDLVRNLSPEGFTEAVKAIMTTDSFPKMSRFDGMIDGKPYHILGIAKGAGMIMPQMATMLCFILTDIRINVHDLKKALSTAVEASFNRITVDGDTSTNDTVLILANGMAANRTMNAQDLEMFQKGLNQVGIELAAMIVRDGEGATKVVHIRLKGAASEEEANIATRTVANSSLVKTAFYGQDPNWGRILAALGRSNISMKEEGISIWIDDIQIVEKGMGLGPKQEKKAAENMHNKEFHLTIDLNQGNHEYTMITCDLTHEYVSINADYRT